jgi:lipopolysaccharide export system ATP-binding protein
MSNIKKFRIKSFKKKKSILNLEKISFKFGKKTILDNLNLQLNNGQILGLLGPNGVGKSTIFNLITGLISPDYGSIFIDLYLNMVVFFMILQFLKILKLLQKLQ